MAVYWLLFLFPAVCALRNQAQVTGPAAVGRPTQSTVVWSLVLALLVLLIGYRLEVGGDWGAYLRHLREARYDTLSSAITGGDPGYRLLNFVAFKLDGNIALVNLVSAFLFSVGLVIFCRNLPRPWLALAVAVPYMVTVVAMGYTRQSVALGLALLGLVALTKHQNRWFVFWIIGAAAFHKSAVLLLPIAALAATRNKYWTTLWVGVVSLVAYYIFLDRSVNMLYTNYIEAQYHSQGAIIRTGMNLIPAILFIAYGRRFQIQAEEAKLWRWFSILSIVLFLTAITTAATTAVDRIALYMLPLQLVIYAYLPEALGKRGAKNTAITLFVLLYYSCVLFVWLNFAHHANYWLPYRFYPIEAWF